MDEIKEIAKGNYNGLRDLGKASGESSFGLSNSIMNKGNESLRAKGVSQGPANFDTSARTDTGLSMDTIRRGNANLRAGSLDPNYKSASGWKGGQGSFGTPGDADKALNQFRQANEIRQGMIDAGRPENNGFKTATFIRNSRATLGGGEHPALDKMTRAAAIKKSDVLPQNDDASDAISAALGLAAQQSAEAEAAGRRANQRARGVAAITIQDEPIVKRGYAKGGQVGLRGYQKGGYVAPRNIQEIEAEQRATRAAWEKKPPTLKAKDWNDPRPEGNQVHRLAPEGPKVVENGMRKFNKGGCVTPKRKMNQPGYAHGGKIKMPGKGDIPEMPGPIGDVAQDTGKDIEQVAVRPGEYLLNPETVAFMGQGDYENGVRNLDQIVKQATGEEPGPEMVEAPEGGEEEMMGFAFGGQNPRGSPLKPVVYVDSMGAATTAPPLTDAEIAAYNDSPEGKQTARGVNKAQLADRGFGQGSAPTGTPQKPWHAKYPWLEPEKWSKSQVGGAVLGGGVEVVRQLGDKQKGQFYDDPNVAASDKALQLGSDAIDTGLRYGAGTVGAGFGAALGTGVASIPLGVAGGVGGYMAGDAVWEGDNTLLAEYRKTHPVGAESAAVTPPITDPVLQHIAERDSKATMDKLYAPTADGLRAAPRQFISPQGTVVTTGGPAAPLRQSEDQMLANYLAVNGEDAGAGVNAGNLRAMPGTDAKYAGRYGNQEVVVTRGANGEPTFTGYRSPQEVAASEARAIEAARPKTNEEILRERALYLNNSWEPDAVRARANGEAAKMMDSLAGIEQARVQATERAAGKTTKERDVKADARIKERFRIPVEGKNGQIAYVEDTAKATAFRDAMSQLGVDIYGMPEAQQDQAFNDFEAVYNDILISQRAAKKQGLPVSDVPRTGDNSLRRIPDSNIKVGDVMGPEATWGDYWAGVNDDDPRNDEFVVDPVSGARIPARQALKTQGNSLESLRNYGYLGK